MQDQNITKFEVSVPRVGCHDLTVIHFSCCHAFCLLVHKRRCM